MFKEEYKNKLDPEVIKYFCFRPDKNKIYLILRLFNDGHLKTVNELFALLSPICVNPNNRGNLRKYIKEQLDYDGPVETVLDEKLINKIKGN